MTDYYGNVVINEFVNVIENMRGFYERLFNSR